MNVFFILNIYSSVLLNILLIVQKCNDFEDFYIAIS